MLLSTTEDLFLYSLLNISSLNRYNEEFLPLIYVKLFFERNSTFQKNALLVYYCQAFLRKVCDRIHTHWCTPPELLCVFFLARLRYHQSALYQKCRKCTKEQRANRQFTPLLMQCQKFILEPLLDSQTMRKNGEIPIAPCHTPLIV